MVMAIVLSCIVALVSHTYRVHDVVTGTMIMEEVLVKTRNLSEEGISGELGALEAYGEELGNPRLWLGAYELNLEFDENVVSGTANAGDWSAQMEIEMFQPGQFLRRFEAIRELGEELTDDGSGIQKGNEPELYDNPAADNRE